MGVTYKVVAAIVTFIRAGVQECPMQERFDDCHDYLSPEMWAIMVAQRCIGIGWIPAGSIRIVTVCYVYDEE